MACALYAASHERTLADIAAAFAAKAENNSGAWTKG